MAITAQQVRGLSRAAGTIDTATTHDIVTPTSGKRLMLYGYMVQNQSETETTVLIYMGANLIANVVLAAKQCVSEGWPFGILYGVDEKFRISLGGANTHSYAFIYDEV